MANSGTNRETHRLDIFQSMQFGTKASMNTQELLVHDRRQRQRAEGFDASLVNFLAVLVLAFELEGEIICKMSALVVASQEPECVGIPDLQSPEVQNALKKRQNHIRKLKRKTAYLNAKIASVDIVTQEQVSCFRRIATDFEQFHQIVVLTVDVAAHRDGCIHLQQVRLRPQNLSAFLYDP